MKYEEKGCDEMRVAAEGGACTRAGVLVRRRLRVCRLLLKQAGLVGYYLYGGGESEDEAYSLCSCSVLLRERSTWVQQGD